MMCIRTRHFSFNRILLLSVGLWPYERTKFIEFQVILFHIIVISFIVFQLTVFLTIECTFDLVVKILSIALFFLIYMINYYSFRINAESVGYLLEQLQHIFNELRDENEMAIIKKYEDNGKRFTNIIASMFICGFISIILLPVLPHFIGTKSTLLNGSHLYDFLQNFKVEYFIDKETYSYLIILHADAAIYIGSAAFVGTGTLVMAYMKYVCGIFRITSYRIEKAMSINMLENMSLENEIIMYKEVTYAVDLHCKAIRIATFAVSSFQRSYFFLTLIIVVCFSLNLYECTEIVLLEEPIVSVFLVHFLILLVLLGCIFFGCHIGQEITDYNRHIFSTVYNVRWYMAPLQVQKILLFLLQRGSKDFILNVGGIFKVSLELFFKLTKASVSYFTVVYSMQQQDDTV